MQNVQHESYGGPVVNDTYLTAISAVLHESFQLRSCMYICVK